MIISELILGLVFGLLFIKLPSELENFYRGTYFSGICRFYGSLSLIFFAIVFLIGIFGAIELGKDGLIKKAIYYSLGFWIISLIIYSISFNYFSYDLNWRILPNFIILIGVISGFNIGLISTTKKINAN